RATVRTTRTVGVRLRYRLSSLPGGWGDWETVDQQVRAAETIPGGWQTAECVLALPPEESNMAAQVAGDIWMFGETDIGEMTLHREQPIINTLDPVTPEHAINEIRTVANSSGAGGPIHIAYTARDSDGYKANYQWDRLDNPSLDSALKDVVGRPGAPEAWFEPGRRIVTQPRAGGTIRGFTLNMHTVIDATIESDTAEQWHSIRAQAGWAAGPAEPVIGVNHEPPGDVVRRQTTTTVPDNLDYKAARDHADARLRRLSTPQLSVHATVTPEIADNLELGDCVYTVLPFRGYMLRRWLRIGRIVWDPKPDLWRLELGMDRYTQELEEEEES
ncbi:MAG TPA: hypothetical protein VK054_09060, partial [Beutenbergiaceae bacterium]|nr:hypothetical protein [Beutenbergiaceae bacterium]